jgi:hypothetical protein
MGENARSTSGSLVCGDTGASRVPFAKHQRLADYFARLEKRPSYARVLEEAAPYLHMVPA